MQHLIIFARHPELGRVKTRLAADIGAEAALAVYRQLLAHTRAVVAPLDVHKTVWLAETPHIPEQADDWTGYEQLPQPPGDLGQKMQTAFAHDLARNAEKVVIIGTDCPGLTTVHLEAAFAALDIHDVVVGPAADGGYYLLGMKKLYIDFFRNKPWSTATVLAETEADAARLQLRLHRLPELHDIDTGSDWRAWQVVAGQTSD
ncbi:TIGR04282 family arsenosugar biosynthesis glycosyltransferase [Hymenobacter swuensis]|uniref:Glycosyltransferase n=1 Tax=Hymenobacter swuensis DY53 TaxID=1227739 RepID=W8F8W1_9BACT|nr:TIGR04282 family arsenosugar biosynthesis glycosyltransferase [Hymenobacter swuensis]AHJ98165.1 hypothetical protein Hsw_2570 [Hymenobacter swuensis DY53]